MDDQTSNVAPSTGTSANGGAGPLVAVVVVVVVILVGAFYFWNQRAGVDTEAEITAEVEAITSQSSSDETTDIEADLDSTELDNIDAELNAI